MSEFFKTQMGHKFYEGTMPQLVKQLARIADHLEAKATQQVANDAPPEKKAPSPPPGTVPRQDCQRNMLEVSTVHIDKACADALDNICASKREIRLISLLEATENYIWAYPRGEYGWFVAVPDEPLTVTSITHPDFEPLRPLFLVLAYAQKHGFDWVLLDAAGPKISDLTAYDW